MAQLVQVVDQTDGSLKSFIDLSWDATKGLRSNKGFGIGADGPNGVGAAFGDGIALGVADAATGRLRYNDTTKQFQSSTDAGAWTPVITGTVAAGQIPFATALNVLGSEAALAYDSAANRLTVGGVIRGNSFGVGTDTPEASIDISGGVIARGAVSIATGSGLALGVSAGIGQLYTQLIGTGYLPTKFYGEYLSFNLGVGGSTEMVRIAQDGGFALLNSDAAIAVAGRGVFRYNNSINKLQFSNNGGAFGDLGSSSATIGGTIANRQVGFGTGADTLGGSATFLYSTNLNLLLGTSTDITNTRLHVFADKSGATGTAWDGVKFGASTYTLSGGGFTSELGLVRFAQPTITNPGASTVGDSATVIIDDAPLQAGSVTLTRKWALKLNSGAFAIDAPGTLASPGFRFGGFISDTFGFYSPAGATYGMSVGGVEFLRVVSGTGTSVSFWTALAADGTNPAVSIQQSPGAGRSSVTDLNGPLSSDAATTSATLQVHLTNKITTPTIGFSWKGVDIRASTLTFTGTGQASLGSGMATFFGKPTITRDNGNTYTFTGIATTIWIDGPPTLTNVTATGGIRALYVNSGITELKDDVILAASGGTVGFFGSAGAVKQAITGSRAGNAALASLLTALASSHGLITDSTSA